MASADENLAKYLRDVHNLRRVERTEELDLLAASRSGDEAATKRVFDGYLELTVLLALRLAPLWMPSLDAIQEANLVLNRLIPDRSVSKPVAQLTSALSQHYDEIERKRTD